MADNGVFSLYVTDYTRNDQVAIVQNNWWPSSISDRILLIEMWDAAAEMGPSLKTGDFIYIGNARMVTNHYTGYLQAKLQQNKIRRLLETDTDPHLSDLLEWAYLFIYL